MSDDIEKAERELREADDKRFLASQARKWRYGGIFLLLFTPAAPVLLWVGLWGENGWVLLAFGVVCLALKAIMDWRKKTRQYDRVFGVLRDGQN